MKTWTPEQLARMGPRLTYAADDLENEGVTISDYDADLGDDFTEEDLSVALDFMRLHPGCNWAQAREYAVQQRGSQVDDDGEFLEADLAVAEEYMRANPGCEWSAARSHAIKSRPPGGPTTSKP